MPKGRGEGLVNYVELHIGDYEKATAHLTATEDGIYGRLLRRYYDTEEPLPLDLKALQRLVRARSRDEKAAVETVLEEFFVETAEGWRHKRCDEEIARYQEKRTKAKRSAQVRWTKNAEECDRNANASAGDDANAMRTHCEGNAHQTPDTRHQTKASPPASTPVACAHTHDPTDAGRACRLMRDAGCASTNPSHPDLIAGLGEGVTPEAFGDTAREAVELGKPKPFAWAIATARGRHEEGARSITTGQPRAGPSPQAQGGKTMQGLQALEGMKRGNRTEQRLAVGRDPHGAAEAGVPRIAGTHAGR